MSTVRKIANRIPIAGHVLVVGIGSPHGDDQAGWKVVEQLKVRRVSGVEFQLATVPHDMVDWLGGVAEMHIVDGCSSGSEEDSVRRFDFGDHWLSDRSNSSCVGPTPCLPTGATLDRVFSKFRSAGSHQIDILTVLELAKCLKLLPHRVVLWAIPGSKFGPGDTLTAGCLALIADCVEQLSRELSDA